MNGLRGTHSACMPRVHSWRAFAAWSTACMDRLKDGAAAPIAQDEDLHTPVAIVGAGPTGLTMALLLSRLGVRSMVFEQSAGITNHPQAHFINHRTMEIFDVLSPLAEQVKAKSPPLRDWRHFVYCESMSGHIFGKVDHFKGQETALQPAISPQPVTHLSQHRLLPLLAEMVNHAPECRIHFGARVSLSDPGSSTRPGVRAAVTGAMYRNLRCDYLIAADGARSALRQQLGVAMSGPGVKQHLINVHFSSPGLGRALRGREAMLYFVFNPDVVAVIVAHDIERGEFVAQIPYFPPLQTPDDFSSSVCAQLVQAATGIPGLELSVLSIRSWIMSAQVAETYQVGNVFLAGDAAHVFPPAGGFGMNTGIQDAHNLAWKLAAVMQGRARPSLLQSYTAERHGVAKANMQLSVTNFQEAMRVPSALGLDPRAASALNSVVSSAPLAALLPQTMLKAGLESALSLGKAASGLKGPLKQWRSQRLKQVLDRGESLRLQFPKEDLGFQYRQPGAAVDLRADEGDPSTSTAPGGNFRLGAATRSEYQPSTLPGSRLPHCGLDNELSTLHALHPSWLTLLLAPSASLSDWLKAAASVQIERVVLVASGVDELAALDDAGMRQILHDHGAVFGLEKTHAPASHGGIASAWPGMECVVLTEAHGQWVALRGVPPKGALLVRPDAHIAWRAHGSVDHEELARAVKIA